MRRMILLSLFALLLGLPALAANDGADPLQSARPCLVSISVKDLDETVKWYQDNLGFQVVKRMEFPKLMLRIAFADRNEFRVELIEFKQSVSYDTIRKQFPVVDDRAKIQGFGKLAFRVDDVEATAALLKKKNVKFEVELFEDKELGEKSFIISDNSGNWIQFLQKTPVP